MLSKPVFLICYEYSGEIQIFSRKETVRIVIACSATASTASQMISSQELHEASCVRRHFPHCSTAEGLSVTKNPFVFFNIYGHSCLPKLTPTASSEQKKKYESEYYSASTT